MENTPPDSEHKAGFGLFLISAAVLALQVLQTRILSVQMWHHHSYMVVTMTLLGFAAAGSLVTVCPGLMGRQLARNASLAASLFALSSLGGFLLLSATADRAAAMTAERNYLALSLFYSYLLLPYFFGGLVITLLLSATSRVSKLYFVNLIGSALGAWLFVALVTPLGAERLFVLCTALGPLAALSLGRTRAQATSSGFALGLALLMLCTCGVAFLNAPDWFRIQVASNKYMADTLARVPGAKHVDQRWSSLCRLDLVELPPDESGPQPIHIYQDGDAITVMHSDASFRSMRDQLPVALNQLAYEPQQIRMERGEPAPEALAIGIGGGIDLRFAMEMGSASVLGIEINPVTIDLVRNEWSNYNGDVYHQPGVEVQLGEGRSTLRRLERRFDVIELSGTDTYTAGNAGAYVLSESYLYTREALREYFEHLDPERGTLGILRLGYDPPRENLRLFAIALEVLRDDFGIADPGQHAVTIYQEIPHPKTGEIIRFAGNVFARQPFDAEMLARFSQANLVPYWRLAYLPGRDNNDPNFAGLAAAIAAGEEAEFYRNYPFDVRPVSDDAPFFFNFYPISTLFKGSKAELGIQGRDDWHALTGGPIGLEIMASLLIQTSLLVALLVGLPLILLKREGLAAPSAGRHLLYFLALGAGFMFLEISTMQRLVLFLGHPTYSITVTLSCFLFFAGLGSLFAGRFASAPAGALRAACAFIVVYTLLLAFLSERLLDATLRLELPWRIGLVVALLAPLNLAMGMPFPLGLGRLKRLAPRLVPWAMGVNGGASVVASILCIVIAMGGGFRLVAILAAALYGLGALAETTGSLSAAKAEPSNP